MQQKSAIPSHQWYYYTSIQANVIQVQ